MFNVYGKLSFHQSNLLSNGLTSASLAQMEFGGKIFLV